eukprot:jgi/Tetstr1/424245/TSEL_001438.t1
MGHLLQPARMPSIAASQPTGLRPQARLPLSQRNRLVATPASVARQRLAPEPRSHRASGRCRAGGEKPFGDKDGATGLPQGPAEDHPLGNP